MINSTPVSASLNDQPIRLDSDDLLEIGRYANGLCEFVRRADTPLTIGIQGGWGSGKTSLINILAARLASGEPCAGPVGDPAPAAHRAVCVSINAWEHSLFQEESRATVAFAILDGIVRSMMRAVADSPLIGSAAKDSILDRRLPEQLTKTRRLVFGLAAAGLNAASGGMIKHFVEGAELALGPAEEAAEESSLAGSVAEQVQALRASVNRLVEQTIVRVPEIDRFVIFVDDLDRVHPETAVEILDVLKNVFDVARCVFVLAIDYDVVIKGLSAKFGERTASNEREFRQYFDKIIQVPFSMPVTAYERRLERLIDDSISKLSRNFDPNADALATMASIAWHVTDGSPRSVKRIINTLSLLQLIQRLDDEAAPGFNEEAEGREYEEAKGLRESGEWIVRIAVVGMQINFPEVYRELTLAPDFTKWQPKAPLPTSAGEPGWIERIRELYAGQPWALTKLPALVQALQLVASTLQTIDTDRVQSASGSGIAMLEDILDATSVTSVGESQPHVTPTSDSIREDYVTHLCRRCVKELDKHKTAPFRIVQPDQTSFYAGRAATGRGNREYHFAVQAERMSDAGLHFRRHKDRKTFDVECLIQVDGKYGEKGALKAGLRDLSNPDLNYVRGGLVSSRPIQIRTDEPISESAAAVVAHLESFATELTKELNRIVREA